MKVKSINSRYDVGNLGQVEAKSFLTHSVALACSLLKFDGTLGNIDALISSKLQHPRRGKPPDIGDWFVSMGGGGGGGGGGVRFNALPPPPHPQAQNFVQILHIDLLAKIWISLVSGKSPLKGL